MQFLSVIWDIVKFKLFLPSTRNGSSEIITSLLLKRMGYLSPRTNLIEVNINNKSYEMIFQEKATKEMLEHNKLRESAILESDESLLWDIRAKNGSSNANNIFPKAIHSFPPEINRRNPVVSIAEVMKVTVAAIEDFDR